MTALRGNPESLIVISVHRPGYYGELADRDEPEFTSTILWFTAFNVAGAMAMKIPALVPGLSRQELAHLIAGGQPTWSIVDKATRHAEQRIKDGLPLVPRDREAKHPLPEGSSV